MVYTGDNRCFVLHFFVTTSLKLAGSHVVVYPCLVVWADGRRGIEESGQQILLHVADLGRILLKADEHVVNMVLGELHESALDHFSWLIISGNTDGLYVTTGLCKISYLVVRESELKFIVVL